MSSLDLLGLAAAAPDRREADTDTVRRIVSELDRLEPDRARFLAAFAYVLSRVAAADLHISDVETEAMVEIVARVGQLPEEQAVLAVAIAKHQNRLFGGTENFLVTREFREVSTEQQRRDLLNCLLAVSVADDSISSAEEAQIAQVARELGVGHQEYVRALNSFADKRSVLKTSPPPRPT
jgi:uncharacterized tellurite resistance protein B-like protein